MHKINKYLWVLLAILQLSFCLRRIKDGSDVVSDKRYAVYLLKAPDAPVPYDGWTCGGALVSHSFVITAAACIDDLQRMYVIAGYRKFISSTQLEKNRCTNRMKKRVVFTCVPKDYNLDYHKTESWARIDIGVVKIESPYDFTDRSFEKYCSYIPAPIKINYAETFQKPGTDALALGWGHAKQFRENLRNTSYNQDTLQYAPTKILDKKTCLNHFPINKNMWPIIQTYMICTLEPGQLNDNGDLIVKSPPGACITRGQKLMGMVGRTCEGDNNDKIDSNTRQIISELGAPFRRIKKLRRKKKRGQSVLETTTIINKRIVLSSDLDGADREAKETPGICQNDHGGPIITWEGTHEILIGVATLYKLDEESRCIGPYLFTSTYCNGAFLQCILSMENETDTGRRCTNTKGQTIKMVQRRISWEDYNPVSLRNGKIFKRPQVPISVFRPTRS